MGRSVEREGAEQKSVKEMVLVTFNLVALHIAILHFTYDGDTSDNNRQK